MCDIKRRVNPCYGFAPWRSLWGTVSVGRAMASLVSWEQGLDLLHLGDMEVGDSTPEDLGTFVLCL